MYLYYYIVINESIMYWYINRNWSTVLYTHTHTHITLHKYTHTHTQIGEETL